MPLAYEQEEVKQKLHAIFAHGDLTSIATNTGLNYSILKKSFESSSDRTCTAYVLLLIVCALADIDEERADEFMAIINDLFDQSKRRKPGEPLSVGNSYSDASIALTNAMQSRMNGNCRYSQLVMMQKANRSILKARHFLLDEIAGEPQGLLTPPEPDDLRTVAQAEMRKFRFRRKK